MAATAAVASEEPVAALHQQEPVTAPEQQVAAAEAVVSASLRMLVMASLPEAVQVAAVATAG